MSPVTPSTYLNHIMNTKMLTRARRLFCHADVPASTARHNMRQWARSIRMLGDRWLLARHVSKQA